MNFINKCINWKYNIKRLSLLGYSFTFDLKETELDLIKIEFENIGRSCKIEKLEFVFNKNLLEYKSHELGKEFYYSEDLKPNALLGEWFEIVFSHIHRNGNEYLTGRITFDFDTQLSETDLIKLTGVKSLIIFNPHYKAWDSNKSPNAYKYKGGLNIYYSEKFHMEMVDISNRPGRPKWKEDFFFHGGSDYWFGPAFFNIVPKETLQSFTDCDVNEMLENGLIHIKLFDLIDYWKDENQQRLAKFREILKIDED
jgi:hypothetical protein